ncbi:MAG: hypothetical protein M1821_008874 [Bathelium mastoideum]|nr:MAG: hypothetical protein M1821_008874 [Bathelium mastoideum]
MERSITCQASRLRRQAQTFSHTVSSSCIFCRPSSSFAHLSTELPSRRLPILYDYLTPVPSHLLTTTLIDFLPPSFAQHYLSSSSSNTTTSSTPNPPLPSTTNPPITSLPPAYHLIHFPPPTPPSALLPDGTDPLQSPGTPFVRRMWAGGALRFNPSSHKSRSGSVSLRGQRAACVERIVDVSVKGREGEEKVFVGIERRVGECGEGEGEEAVRERLGAEDGEGVACVERRNIVFMRERETGKVGGVEGEKAEGSGGIKEIEYRNLAPLYATEEMKVCGREIEENGKSERKFEVWVEGAEGGMSVRGVAKVAVV